MVALEEQLEAGAVPPDEENGLPEGWAQTTLGEICHHPQYGWTTRANATTNGLKFLRTSDISNGKVDWDTVPGCDQEPPELSKFLLTPGDIVISRAGSIGISYLVRECPPAVFASYLIRFRPLLPETASFIAWFLQSPDYWAAVEESATGITIGNVNASKLGELRIPLPPLPEQRRIVEKVEQLLQRVNASRERLANVPTILKRFRQSVLAAACSGRLTAEWREEHPETTPVWGLVKSFFQALPCRLIGESPAVNTPERPVQNKPHYLKINHEPVEGRHDLPDTWAWFTAGTFYRDARYGTSAKCERCQGDVVPVVRIPNIATGVLDLSDIKCAPLNERETASLTLCEGDVLVCRTNGSLDLIGKSAVVPKLEKSYAFASYLIRLRPEEQLLVANYLHLCLNSPSGRDHIRERARTTAGQFNLNLDILDELPIPLPPLLEQREITRRVAVLFALADAVDKRVQAAMTRAEKLTQAILAKAFQGELVPTEAELARKEGRGYESASVLLERIRKERAEEPKPPPAKTRARKVKEVIDG